MIRNILKIGVLLFFLDKINGQTNLPNITTSTGDKGDEIEASENYNPDLNYCLRFTWLGPQFDQQSDLNGTCKGMREEFGMKDIPCRHPLVATYNGTKPNITYMWENYRDRIICKMTGGLYCVKYTYSFNYEVQNVTYMCAKVLVEEEGAIKSGCFSQWENGYEIEVCVCSDSQHGQIPCNSASTSSNSIIFSVLALVVFFIKYK